MKENRGHARCIASGLQYIFEKKEFDFVKLSDEDIKELIEAKKMKEAERVVRVWDKEGIRIEKARWGRHNLVKGKTKIELNKSIAVADLSLAEVQEMLTQSKPKKKKTKK